jgi:hypothetical protein
MSSETDARRCIYTTPEGLCEGTEDFSEEDYLPRGLGKFKGYQRLKDKICRNCNHRLGDLDNLLLTSGPEAIFRAIHGIEGRKKHRARDVFHEMTHGRPPIEVFARLPGDASPTRVEILGGNFGQPRRELVFEWADGRSKRVPIPRSIDTPEKLDGHLQRKGIKREGSKCIVYCPEGDDGFRDVVQRCLGKIETLGGPPDLSNYPAELPAAALIQLSPEYHRAIAKIAFHFFLWCSFPGITGFEPEFDSIKRFIWQGGDPNNRVLSNAGPFERDQIGDDATYAHILSAGVDHNEVAATVQLFAGSDSGMNLLAKANDGRSFPVQFKNMSFIRFVKLGRSPFRIACDLRRALQFTAYRRSIDGFIGEVRELTPTRQIVIWRPGVGPRFWT